MSKITNQSCFTGSCLKGPWRVYETWFFALLALALLLGSSPVRADGPDDEYMQIYNLIQQADTLATSGKPTLAKAKYQEAQTALKSFQKEYPEWNVKLVAYRLNYVLGKLAALTQKPPATAGNGSATIDQPAQPQTTAASPASTMQVKLSGAGRETRKALRLPPSPGDKQTLALTIKMAMETKMGETETPAMKMPPIKMTMNSTVKEVSDIGDISCEFVMGDISVSDAPEATSAVAEMMKTARSEEHTSE